MWFEVSNDFYVKVATTLDIFDETISYIKQNLEFIKITRNRFKVITKILIHYRDYVNRCFETMTQTILLIFSKRSIFKQYKIFDANLNRKYIELTRISHIQLKIKLKCPQY